jgi:serine/threonine protein kinase
MFIDFESSVIVSLKNPNVKSVEKGTYLYMSPEQTGRTNSLIDKTSDIYSLGITFFQMLTGKTPFQGDVSKVIYSHIAVEPPKMNSISQENIPECLEQLVAKMIKKNKSERYSSIFGVKKELEFLQFKGFDEPFTAGQLDVKDTFQFGTKLYGRDDEVNMLIEILKNVQNKNMIDMTMITGSSGIGKSVNFYQNNVSAFGG